MRHRRGNLKAAAAAASDCAEPDANREAAHERAANHGWSIRPSISGTQDRVSAAAGLMGGNDCFCPRKHATPPQLTLRSRYSSLFSTWRCVRCTSFAFVYVVMTACAYPGSVRARGVSSARVTCCERVTGPRFCMHVALVPSRRSKGVVKAGEWATRCTGEEGTCQLGHRTGLALLTMTPVGVWRACTMLSSSRRWRADTSRPIMWYGGGFGRTMLAGRDDENMVGEGLCDVGVSVRMADKGAFLSRGSLRSAAAVFFSERPKGCWSKAM